MSMQDHLKRLGAALAFAVALSLAAPPSGQAATTEILAVGTTAANSSDVVVAAGTTLAVTLKDAAGPTLGAGALVHVLRKDDAGQYFRVAALTTNAPDLLIEEAGTYRFSRVAGTSAGVFGDVGGGAGGGGGGAATIADGADVTQGAVADAVVAAGAAGTVSAKLRRLTTDLSAMSAKLPAALGGTTAANSLPVGLSSDGPFSNLTGAVTETAPASDTASSGLNGRLQRIAQNLTSLLGSAALIPTAASTNAITPVPSTAAESNHVLKASAGNLYGFSATTGASAGYVMIFNATSAPADGAVTPVFCYSVPATGSVGAAWNQPAAFSTGITIVFSTTGCFTKTASATAFFSGAVK